jgi:hypothetical protein
MSRATVTNRAGRLKLRLGEVAQYCHGVLEVAERTKLSMGCAFALLANDTLWLGTAAVFFSCKDYDIMWIFFCKPMFMMTTLIRFFNTSPLPGCQSWGSIAYMKL